MKLTLILSWAPQKDLVGRIWSACLEFDTRVLNRCVWVSCILLIKFNSVISLEIIATFGGLTKGSAATSTSLASKDANFLWIDNGNRVPLVIPRRIVQRQFPVDQEYFVFILSFGFVYLSLPSGRRLKCFFSLHACHHKTITGAHRSPRAHFWSNHKRDENTCRCGLRHSRGDQEQSEIQKKMQRQQWQGSWK